MYLKGRLRKTNFNIHKIPTMPLNILHWKSQFLKVFHMSMWYSCQIGVMYPCPGFAAIEIDRLQIRSLSKRYEQARILLQIIHLVSDVCYLRIHKVI